MTRPNSNARAAFERGEHSNGTLQRRAAAAWLGIGVDHFDREVRPHVRVARVGGLRLWPVAELRRFIDERLEDPPTAEADTGLASPSRLNGPVGTGAEKVMAP
jgi:hypothetical protein